MAERRSRGGWQSWAGGALFSAALLVHGPARGEPEPPSPAAAECLLEAGPRRAVTRVIDAETVLLDDGAEVRLIGALAPRAPTPGADWPPERDAADALKKLVLGRSVALAFQGRRVDRYGRLLAHLFVGEGGGREWVQGAMLTGGHARAYALDGSTACFAELIEHEAVGRRARAGLWASAAYQVRSALRTRELLRYRGTFQLIAGEIVDVAESKGRLYVNFGGNWREDFTLGIDAATLRNNPALAEELKGLKGRRVVVRGWLERRNGPYVEIMHPRQIALDDAAEPAAAAAAGEAPAPQTLPARPSRQKKTRPMHKAPGALDL